VNKKKVSPGGETFHERTFKRLTGKFPVTRDEGPFPGKVSGGNDPVIKPRGRHFSASGVGFNVWRGVNSVGLQFGQGLSPSPESMVWRSPCRIPLSTTHY